MPDAPRLVREQAGRYRSSDDRFGVQEDDGAWFVEDHAQLTGFGQPLILGPFGSLKLARAAIEEAATKQVRLTRGTERPRRKARPAPEPQAEPEPSSEPEPEPEPPPEPTWLDRLDDEEASRARAMIRALERLDVEDAEALVREDVGSGVPAVARALLRREIERRVGGEVDREVLADVLDVLTEIGLHQPRDLPGWELIERHGPHPDEPRRIVIREAGVDS
jgi:hypothetical protein